MAYDDIFEGARSLALHPSRLEDPMRGVKQAASYGNTGAERIFKAVSRRVAALQAHLDHEHEVGAVLANAPGVGIIHVDSISAQNPDLIFISGVSADRLPVELVMHFSQLAVTLTSVPKLDEQPRRIGF